MKIEKYKILKGFDADKLEEEVSKFIKDGFTPYGHLSVARLPDGKVQYLQPVVKFAKPYGMTTIQE